MFKKLHTSISAQIIFIVLLTSSVATFVVVSVQLYMDYKTELSELDKKFHMIEEAYKPSFESALWNLDNRQMDLQIKGILNYPEMSSIEIYSENQLINRGGVLPWKQTVTYIIPLQHFDSNGHLLTLGRMVIQSDLEVIYNLLWKKINVILFSQFLKTFFVSALLVFGLDKILTRHLLKTEKYLRQCSSAKDIQAPLQLNRSSSFNDEITSLQKSINVMYQTSIKNLQTLADFNHNLEQKVKDRSDTVTEQRHQLELSSKLSELGVMAGGIAHELNNPLTVITLLVEVSLLEIKNGTATVSTLEISQQKILKMALRMSKITSSMLTLMRDGSKDPMTVFGFHSLLEETLSLCSSKLNRAHIKLSIKNTSDIQLLGRPSQISQVLLNLINNAFDSIKNLEDRWINISADVDGSLVRIRVTDSGYGISNEDLNRIFLPFYTTKSIGQGIGLGLSISRSLIEQHDGNLFYNKNSDRTEFVIQLPIVVSRTPIFETESLAIH